MAEKTGSRAKIKPIFHEAVGAAHQPQADDGAPFHRSGGQGGSLEQAHSHGAQGGGYTQLDDADEEGVLLFGDLVQDDDVDGVEQCAHETEQRALVQSQSVGGGQQEETADGDADACHHGLFRQLPFQEALQDGHQHDGCAGQEAGGTWAGRPGS